MYQSDLKHSDKTLEDKLQQLYTLSGKKNLALELFRDPYIKLLEAFGHPQEKLPPVVHVAGTNGKGSIIASLRSIYEAAGYKVHVYTSPHLIRFNERIVLAGEQISDDALEALIDEALALNAGRDATFFEAATAMAFAAFARVPADICLIEVGLGGRLDCTNIIQRPALSVISAIGMDHMDYLGDTIEKIAAEKGGIIKDGVPCVVGVQHHKSVYHVLQNIAQTNNATIFTAGRDVDFEVSLPGAHQRMNAAAALAAVDALQDRFPVEEKTIQKGLRSVRWPARLQRLPARAYGFDDDVTLWLDGGHNDDAGAALAAHIKTLDAPVHFICAMLKHKNPAGYLAPILPHVASTTFTTLPDEPTSLTAEALVRSAGYDGAQTASDYQSALKALVDTIKEPAHILIGGSLYLAGEVLRDLEDRGHT